jgi:transposase
MVRCPKHEIVGCGALMVQRVLWGFGVGVNVAEVEPTLACNSAIPSTSNQFPSVLADRGYDADSIRELVRQQGARADIPPKRNRKDPICFSPYLYRARSLVERFFNKIKQCQRVATRYDKLAANYLAFVKLASIRIWLRANESVP